MRATTDVVATDEARLWEQVIRTSWIEAARDGGVAPTGPGDQVEGAVDNGIDVRGLSWHTAIDGDEWLAGFDHPRGLLTPDRNPKPSFDRLRPYLHP